MSKYLMRTWYKTEAAEHEGEGIFSASIPDAAFNNSTILDVNWSTRGEVQVTFLMEGPSPYND